MRYARFSGHSPAVPGGTVEGTELLATAALVGGLTMAGAGTASARNAVYGPFSTYEYCVAHAEAASISPDIWASACIHNTNPVYPPGVGLCFWTSWPD